MLKKLSEFRLKKKELILIGIIMLVYFVQKLFMYKLGIYMEECRDANAQLMVLNGKVPYRDFRFWVYGPFVFCIYPLIFKIFGAGLAVFRLSYIVVGAFVIPLVYCLARRLMAPLWAGIAAFLSIVLIDVPYYTYNHIFATVAGLIALLFVIKFMEEYATHYLFLSGIFIGIALLVKPYIMGFGTLFSILLFIFFLKFQRSPMPRIKLSHVMAVLAGLLLALAPCIVYFIIHNSLYKFLANITPLGPDRAGSFYVYSGRGFSLPIGQHLAHFVSIFILPFKALFFPGQWKGLLIEQYYQLLLYSPIIFSLAIFLLNKFVFHKYDLVSKMALRYLLLFTVFSIFISAQFFLVFALLGRSFTMQVPFVIIAYFLSLINNKKLYRQASFRRYIIAALSVCFVFYLSFLHFFRYPYSRNKSFVVPLELERAKGIRVTYPEKQLYESLNKFLSENTQPDESIGVLGYYPQFAFFLKRENVFGDIEDEWVKFRNVEDISKLDPSIKKAEDHLIGRLKLKKPRFVISPIITSSSYRFLTPKLIKYINRKYNVEKTLGPAYIDIYTPGVVRVYRRLD